VRKIEVFRIIYKGKDLGCSPDMSGLDDLEVSVIGQVVRDCEEADRLAEQGKVSVTLCQNRRELADRLAKRLGFELVFSDTVVELGDQRERASRNRYYIAKARFHRHNYNESFGLADFCNS
jgi:hypothetical protein